MGHECNRPKELAAFLANPGTHSRVLFEHRRYMRFLIGARVVGFAFCRVHAPLGLWDLGSGRSRLVEVSFPCAWRVRGEAEGLWACFED